MTTEIAKSLEGQRRIAATSAKLDVTVEQLGNPLRSDLPQVKSELPAAKPTIVKKLLLNAQDFDQHGITTGCPKCNYFLKCGKWACNYHGIKHPVRCRERMVTEFAKSLAGQRRIVAASANVDVTVDQFGNPLRSDLPQVKSEPPVKEVAPPLGEHQNPEMFSETSSWGSEARLRRLRPVATPMTSTANQSPKKKHMGSDVWAVGSGSPTSFCRSYMFAEIKHGCDNVACMDELTAMYAKGVRFLLGLALL